MGGNRHLYYSMYYHTNTKLVDNEPYWSLNLLQGERFSISKEDLPSKLKEAQNLLSSSKKQPIRTGKKAKIFVLKLNSPKLKEIIKQEH